MNKRLDTLQSTLDLLVTRLDLWVQSYNLMQLSEIARRKFSLSLRRDRWGGRRWRSSTYETDWLKFRAYPTGFGAEIDNKPSLVLGTAMAPTSRKRGKQGKLAAVDTTRLSGSGGSRSVPFSPSFETERCRVGANNKTVWCIDNTEKRTTDSQQTTLTAGKSKGDETPVSSATPALVI
jgi:hypothetical protein